MKNCADFDPLMTPYVDGEADPADRAALDAHLAGCPPCRERADAERAARSLVQRYVSTLSRPAPAALRARCVGAVPSSRMPPGSSRAGSRVRRWVPVSMAATVLLAVAGVLMVGQQERLEAAFAAQLAIDHEKCFTEFGTGHPPLDAAEAEARLAAEHGIEVSVPASVESDQIELVDVRSCDYDNGHMAHLLYEVQGQPVSLFVIPETRPGERTLEVVGHEARLWSSDDAGYVFVGPGNADAMDKVAGYMRGYAR